MAWKYPKYDIKSGYVIDVDPINENLAGVVNEVSNGLNEHNLSLSSTSALTRSQLARGAAFKLHKTSDEVSPLTNAAVDADWIKIARRDGWQTFNGDGVKLTFTTKGALTWVCASFQLVCTRTVVKGLGADTAPANFQKGFGFLVALKLDGTVINDSLLGSGDPATDFYHGYQNRGSTRVPNSLELCTPQGGGGLSGARLPVVVDAVLDLAPGQHTLEICVCNIQSNNKSTASDEKTYIATRELFALEMRR